MPNETKKVEEVLTRETFDAEMSRLKLEAARLELQEKELNLKDIKERLFEREAARANLGQRSKINGATLKQLARNRMLNQNRCNHKKGGNGAQGVVAGQGDDPQYAVLKHKMANGDTWVRCLRCGKWWTPPIEADFETAEGYIGALKEYKEAVDFTTRNVMSTSIPFQWGDAGKFYREQLRHTPNV